MIRFVRLAWDRLSIYLPIMLMGLLALGTYWLVRSTPLLEPGVTEQPLREDPDYQMERFSIKTFDGNGRLKSEVYGEQARHYPHTDVLEIDRVRIRSFNQRGYLTVATAKRALANNDATEVQLIGDAQVVREATVDRSGTPLPRVSFSGEFLHAYLEEERIKSHKPVELVRGSDRITADSLDYSNFDQVMELRGRVRGILLPPPER
ncbi:LPS export ABC transporter periplasmic protein LptC [Rhodoferax sp. BAB1]|uniref:LPS export ABC transporter periplasmic protein LptC n=1 Tax=Rhodoferax sp. BAB1 TaxID=2741720 RepID=UPI001577060A|nr:LPS export ABC transporter periplasmic protein LptC [Rhodoferax sp. BAB1]QKO23372.1 LPS export ABC transporter periplasmic protein LptC [Rhodoferax sp. BAB1]